MKTGMELRAIGSGFLVGCSCAMLASMPTHAQPGSTEPSPQSGAAVLPDKRPLVVDDAQRRQQEIDRAIESFNAGRPRRGSLTSSNRAPAFAAYFERWASDVILAGNRKLKESSPGKAGRVVATVSILASGELEGVEIDRSSGTESLDDLVKRIAYVAAPFAPFPPDIASRFAVLEVTAACVFSSQRRDESEISIAAGEGVEAFAVIYCGDARSSGL
jgi:protein TonB